MALSHALLLRLFQSPSYFSVHLALQYLSTYHSHIGITHYITGRLREVEPSKLDDVWGFICHLLVTRPSKSCALETFVVGRAEGSTHSALLTLWFMQAYLSDLSTTRRNTASFAICQRVLLKVQNIIFGDPPITSSTPYASLASPITGPSRFWKRKVKPRVAPAIVGIAAVLAGTPGMPQLSMTTGLVAIEQGRVTDDVRESRPFHATADADYVAHILSPSISPPANLSPESDGDDDEVQSSEEEDVDTFGRMSTMAKLILPPDLKPEKMSLQGGSLRRTFSLSRKTAVGAMTSPALVRKRTSRTMGHLQPPPSQSTPSLSLRTSIVQPHQNVVDAILQHLDSVTQSQLLQSHYCRSEVQFLLALESISNRLLVVPKLARLSALRAELTVLNHKLPAEVDIPMWTSDADSPTHSPKGPNRGHNRIVRIPPGECVVLNSAERAPYLLLIEILVGELDFVPLKRANKEILRRIITKEHKIQQSRRSDAGQPPDLNSLPRANGKPSFADSHSHASLAHHSALTSPTTIESVSFPTVPSPPPASFEPQEEEMDLVEQLYGTDLSVRTHPAELSDSIVLPPTPKNKALDIATWSTPSPHSTSPARVTMYASEQATEHLLSPLSSLVPSDPVSNDARHSHHRVLSLEDYSERMRTAAIMLAQLNANLVREAPDPTWSGAALNWITGSRPRSLSDAAAQQAAAPTRMKLQHAEATAIRDKIMQEMMALEEERMERMKETPENVVTVGIGERQVSTQTAEDEGIVRRELNKVDPSAAVFRESWVTKKARIRAASPYGHLAAWDCLSVIVKTGADLRQEQMAVQLIQIFDNIWQQENCGCWVRHFRILITGSNSGLVETVKDAVSIHSIKKAEYARRLAEGRFGHVTLMDHFVAAYGDPSSAKFARAQRCFVKSLAGYSLVTYFLQIKDRHNGNILLDREGHLIHIDFGFLLSNSPGNMGFEAAPFKFPVEYVEVLGGVDSGPFNEFKRLFREGFEAARKHCDSIITIVELMQKDSTLPCFSAFGEQTSQLLRDRFQQGLPHSVVGDHVDRLIMSSMGSAWTRLYDSFQYYSQSIL
ncbi:hypothetical protein BS47DRAFT_1370329 [Hydnum rufescens UP504]|uniref:1-phosphatidylinositol 4-kinase n=1 Tax=Hydnum rufescens UP504 TaxID=1448309 RepID=A0A9P6BB96_9AGAM|nr:hypothetical protein BS47DRAFT_1370329 [Hydnum rufescens UP504]